MRRLDRAVGRASQRYPEDPGGFGSQERRLDARRHTEPNEPVPLGLRYHRHMLDAHPPCIEPLIDESSEEVQHFVDGAISDRMDGDESATCQRVAGEFPVEIGESECACGVDIREGLVHGSRVPSKASVGEPFEAEPPQPGAGTVQ